MAREWTSRQRKFQLWLAMEARERPADMQTREQFAEALGVNMETLAAWERLPGWNEAVGDLSVTIVTRAAPKIMRALVKAAQDGTVTAIKLALEVMGVRIERSEADVTLHGGQDEDDRLVIVVNDGGDKPARKHGQ